MNAALLTFVTALSAAPAPSAPPTLDALRDEAAAVLRLQTVLDWCFHWMRSASHRR